MTASLPGAESRWAASSRTRPYDNRSDRWTEVIIEETSVPVRDRVAGRPDPDMVVAAM